MSVESFAPNLAQLLDAIDLTIEKKLQLPALMLLYAGIDICGWLGATDDAASSRSSFTSWVDKYLLPGSSLTITATDLYAARCGLLHTFTPESRLTDEGKARRLAYAWGNADAAELQKAIDIQGADDISAVHVSSLREAFHRGLKSFIEDVRADPDLAAKFESRAHKTFSPASAKLIEDYLASVKPPRTGA